MVGGLSRADLTRLGRKQGTNVYWEGMSKGLRNVEVSEEEKREEGKAETCVRPLEVTSATEK